MLPSEFLLYVHLMPSVCSGSWGSDEVLDDEEELEELELELELDELLELDEPLFGLLEGFCVVLLEAGLFALLGAAGVSLPPQPVSRTAARTTLAESTRSVRGFKRIRFHSFIDFTIPKHWETDFPV